MTDHAKKPESRLLMVFWVEVLTPVLPMLAIASTVFSARSLTLITILLTLPLSITLIINWIRIPWLRKLVSYDIRFEEDGLAVEHRGRRLAFAWDEIGWASGVLSFRIYDRSGSYLAAMTISVQEATHLQKDIESQLGDYKMPSHVILQVEDPTPNEATATLTYSRRYRLIGTLISGLAMSISVLWVALSLRIDGFPSPAFAETLGPPWVAAVCTGILLLIGVLYVRELWRHRVRISPEAIWLREGREERRLLFAEAQDWWPIRDWNGVPPSIKGRSITLNLGSSFAPVGKRCFDPTEFAEFERVLKRHLATRSRHPQLIYPDPPGPTTS